MAGRSIFEVDVKGAAELNRLFAELPKSVGASVLRSAGKKALQPVLDDAKTRLVRGRHVLSGDTLNSLQIASRVKSSQPRKGGKSMVSVYAGAVGRRGAIAHLIEFGHRLVGGGRAPAYPFLRPAWDAGGEEVKKRMRAEIWASLVKTVRRLRKRAEAGKLSRSQISFFSK